MTTPASAGTRRSRKRTAILRGTQELMLERGYGEVTYRSVAARAGVTPGLVHYYFPSLDDLFIAVLRDSTNRVVGHVDELRGSDQPLRAVWRYVSNSAGTALLMEFMTLANHRKAISADIGEGGERVRRAMLEAVSAKWEEYGLAEENLSPASVLFMMTSVARMVHLEESFGTFTGHAETIALVEQFLDRVEPLPGAASKMRQRAG